MKITSMQKMIAVVVVFVILAAVAFAIFVLPLFAQLDSLALLKAGAEQQRDQAKAQLARLEDAKARSAATEAELLKIGTQMPESPQLPTLIIELQDIANKAGVTVTSFAPSQPNPISGGKFTEISLTTQLTAAWDDLLDYMRRVNKSTRLLRITNVTVNPAASTVTTATADKEIDLNVSLTTKAYVIGANGQIAAAATATPAATSGVTP
jgi:type IV pilus assembly protein PilO